MVVITMMPYLLEKVVMKISNIYQKVNVFNKILLT